MLRAICGVQLKDRKIAKHLMFLLGLSEDIDQWPIARSICCYAHVLEREIGHVLRRALD